MKRILPALLSCAMLVGSLTGCAVANAQTDATNLNTKLSISRTLESKSNLTKAPKYVFMFIGDGMSYVQVNAAQVYEGNNNSGFVEPDLVNFSQFPVTGIATTQDSTSFCPDSASTATSLSTGVKTHSGTIGLEKDLKTEAKTITEYLKEQKEMKIGIVSNVTINHATPAAYYSHVVSRNSYYDIAMQMADSGFDYFGGGSINKPTGDKKDQKDAYEVLKEKGYTIADSNEEILSLNNKSGKVYAVSPKLQDSGAMSYAMDLKEGDLTLADYVKKGIDVLDNNKGFFLMTESGKIDWACHANDAKATIEDVLAFEDAIQVAIDFAEKHPSETLIIVTGDHETGGMTIGYAATGYDTAFDILESQKMSYVAFDELFNKMKNEDTDGLTFEKMMPVITENFGLVNKVGKGAKDDTNNAFELNDYEFDKLVAAFNDSVATDVDKKSYENGLLYGGYNPLSVTLTHIINNKAGIGWTSYSHTGVPVAVYAAGVGADLFNGSYDNTDIFLKLVDATSVSIRK
jgi:alkaline phosphatase